MRGIYKNKFKLIDYFLEEKISQSCKLKAGLSSATYISS